MDKKQLKDKTTQELNADLLALLKTQFGLRMQNAAGQLAKTAELKKVRRNIARVKTALSGKGVN